MNIRDLQNGIIPFVVLPLKSRQASLRPIRGAGLLILESLSQLALSLTGTRPTFVAYHAANRQLFKLEAPSFLQPANTGSPGYRSLRPSQLRQRGFSARGTKRTLPGKLLRWLGASFACLIGNPVGVFMNASFLISEEPPYGALARAALANDQSCCGNPCTRDLYAFAIRLRVEYEDKLHLLLKGLTQCLDEGASLEFVDQACQPELPPAHAGPWNSPAMKGLAHWRGFRPNDAPPYVNAAIEEVCFWPESINVQDPSHDAAGLVASLAEHRERSRVPWIFNELLNEIDYRLGAVHPASLPAELHLSLTGDCNIECRFCSRTIAGGFADIVNLQDLRKFDFLSWVRTLRLTSGNGEPTLIKNLPAIIAWVRRVFPHLGLGFFTNGILLDRNDLIPSLIEGDVSWINVSLNATTRESWRELCQADYFDRVCRNLKMLRDKKIEIRAGSPLVHASMVLTRDTLRELPRMPALCRELGIDRFVAFPFFALGVNRPGRYLEDDAYHHAADLYDQIYETSVERARQFEVSIELPRPLAEKKAGFAIENRILHDFARIERHEWQLGKLLCGFEFPLPEGSFCHFLWRYAAVTSAPVSQVGKVARWLYPCLGPLAPVVMAKQLPFDFPSKVEFETLWQNPLFSFLREAQHQPGKCRVCDACRGCDTRQPDVVQSMKGLVAEFVKERGLGLDQCNGGPMADALK